MVPVAFSGGWRRDKAALQGFQRRYVIHVTSMAGLASLIRRTGN
jgi:hypothetical protein